MSWLYSQALVEEYSQATCWDGAPSVPLNGNPTPLAYLPPDRTKDFSRLSRSGATFAHLTEDLGAGLLTWFLAASRARTSALLARAPESTESAAECGPTWRGSLARFDRASATWRTAQPSLLGDSDECSVTWPNSGMTAGGQCWEQTKLVPRTSEIGSGLWLPTPCTVDTGSMFNKSASDGAALRPTLGAMARFDLWPTPTVNGNYNKVGLSAKSGDGLATAVAKWPTPDAHMGSGGRTSKSPPTGKRASGSKQQITLNDAVKWRSPNTVDAKGGTRKPGTNSQVQLVHQVGGSLNPTWVEWLMGWPIGWTDLKLLATDKCRDVRPKRGACS